MPITIAKIDNLFWKNGSYKFPNKLPEFKEKITIERTPEILNFHGGSTHLHGDWNYAIFEGIFYFLIKKRVLSVKDKHYEYILVRDWWMNIIRKSKVLVTGNVNITSRDKWIEERLNWTTPILANPVEIERSNFVDVDLDWRKTLEIKDCKKIFSSDVVSRISYNWFKERHLSHPSLMVTIVNKLDLYTTFSREVFVLGYLRPTKTTRLNWKNKLINRINSFLKEIKENTEIGIFKINSPNLSPMKGMYTITWKNEGIGATEEAVEIREIDLSGITDIKPINNIDLNEAEPNKSVEDCIFDLDEHFEKTLEVNDDFLLKIHRKAYLPITRDVNKYGIAFKSRSDQESGNEKKYTWNTQIPQKLQLYKNVSGKSVLYLFWLDKINFQLNWNSNYHQKVKRTYSYFPDYGLDYFENKYSFTWGEWYKAGIKTFGIPPMFPTKAVIDDEENGIEYISWLKHNVSQSIGMLIFQTLKDPDEWDRYEYTGDLKISSVKTVLGLNAHFTSSSKSDILKTIKYLSETAGIGSDSLKNDENQFLGKLPKRFSNFSSWYSIKESDEVDKWTSLQNFFLGATTFNGDLFLAPNTAGYYYDWRGYYSDDATSNNYVSTYLKMGNTKIYAPYNNSPWNPDTPTETIKKYWDLKWKTVKAFSIIHNIDLGMEIEKGDYLLSDLEYFLNEYNLEFFPVNKTIDFRPSRHLSGAQSGTKPINPEDWGRTKRDILTGYSWGNFSDTYSGMVKGKDLWKKVGGLAALYDFGIKRENQKHYEHINKEVILMINKYGRLEYRTLIKKSPITLHLDKSMTIEKRQKDIATSQLEISKIEEEEDYKSSSNKEAYKKARTEEIKAKYKLDEDVKFEDIQIVDKVDGSETKKVEYILLKKHKGSEEFTLSQISKLGRIEEEKQEEREKRERSFRNAIKEFYKIHGYKVSRDGTEPKVLMYSEKDFEESNSEHLLFELVGTDWYCHIRKGKISLISKNPKKFIPARKRIKNIELSKRLKDLSIVQKINQKNYLNIYTYKRPINTRFLFKEGEEFNVFIESIEPTNKLTQLNTYFLRGHNKFDVIEQEVIQIPKNAADLSVSIADQISIDSLKIEMARAEENRRIAIDSKIRLEREKLEENYVRSKWNLGMEKFWGRWNSAVSILTSGFSSGESMYDISNDIGRLSAVDPIQTHFGGWQSYGVNTGRELVTSGYQSAIDTRTGYVTGGYHTVRGAARTSLKRALGGKVGIALGAAGDIATSIARWAVNESWVWPEKSRRIEKDRELAFASLALNEYTTELEFARREQDLIRKINRLSNEYVRGEVTELNIAQDYNRAHNLNDLNLSTHYPNEEQTKLLESYKEEYGVECLVPNVTIEIKEGMDEEVIRFEFIEDEGLQGIIDVNERSFLKGLLEKGIKVVDIEKSQPISTITDYRKLYEELKRKMTSTKVELTAAENRANTLSEEYKRLEAEKTEQQNLANLYLQEKKALEKQLADNEYLQDLEGRIRVFEKQQHDWAAEKELSNKLIKEFMENQQRLENRANTLSEEYKRLEAEKTEQQNLANLYLQEKNKLSQEKQQAIEVIKRIEKECEQKGKSPGILRSIIKEVPFLSQIIPTKKRKKKSDEGV